MYREEIAQLTRLRTAILTDRRLPAEPAKKAMSDIDTLIQSILALIPPDTNSVSRIPIG